jgi:hypothetical protein
MPDFFEKWSFTPDFEALGSHQEYTESIQHKLREYLSVREAREIATRVHGLAREIDEDIGGILQDPLARRLYEYDGQFFTPRGTGFFHTAFDGLHLLQWLSNSGMETFFRGREKHRAIGWMFEELGKHAWVARVRRMNWEEFHSLGLVAPEVLEAILEVARERMKAAETGPRPLSAEEQVFFQSFEAQMEGRLAA